MKIRNGFVTNSSSTSYIVTYNNKDEDQRKEVNDIIKSYREYAEDSESGFYNEVTTIKDDFDTNYLAHFGWRYFMDTQRKVDNYNDVLYSWNQLKEIIEENKVIKRMIELEIYCIIDEVVEVRENGCSYRDYELSEVIDNQPEDKDTKKYFVGRYLSIDELLNYGSKEKIENYYQYKDIYETCGELNRLCVDFDDENYFRNLISKVSDGIKVKCEYE